MLFLRAPFLAFVLTTLLMSLFYGDEIAQPNSHYLSKAGDGLKNYYTLQYHQQYDSSFSHFSGMAYPYGEHIVFTDGQPSLAFLLWILPGMENNAIGSINLLLLLGVGLGAWILCKLFIRLGLTRGMSLFAAAAIALLSPQILRFAAHYALAYCFIVPWVFYVALLYVDKPSLKRGIWVFIAILVITGLHLYYFLMAAAFIACFYAIESLRRKNMPLWKYGLAFCAQVIVPFGLFMVWMKVTDSVSDRPSIPYGMREYMALWEGVFLPVYGNNDAAIFRAVGLRPVNSEALAYAGFPAAFYFFYFVFSRIKLVFNKTAPRKFLKAHSFLLAGFLVFLFAATVPFLMDTPFGEKYGGPLRQFRSLGRLSWVLFYSLNIFLFLHLAGRRKRWGMIISTLSIVILFLEGLHFHSLFSGHIGSKQEKQAGIEKLKNYPNHVLFPLPYFHVGSENLGTLHSESYLAEQTMELSMASGYPTFGSMMSRTSLSQTLNHLEMALNLSGPLMHEQKPWLITHSPSYKNRFSQLLPATPHTVIDTLNVYSYTAKELLALKSKTEPQTTDTIPQNVLFYAGFDNTGLPGIAGQSGALLPNGKNLVVYEGNGFADSLSLSFWLDARQDGFRSFRLIIENTQSGEQWVHSPGSLFDNVVDGFARIHLRNQLWNFPCRISIAYDRPADPPMIVDECIISRKNQGFAYKQGNYYIFTDEFVFKPLH